FADVGGDGVEAEVCGDMGGTLTGRMALGGVCCPGKPMPVQRGCDGAVRQADLCGDGADGPVLDDVPLVQIGRYVREAELVQGGQPPGVPASRALLSGRCGRRWVDVSKVA